MLHRYPGKAKTGREPTGITKKHGVVTIAIQQIILEGGDHALIGENITLPGPLEVTRNNPYSREELLKWGKALRTGFSQAPVTQRGGCGTTRSKHPRKNKMQHGAKRSGTQDEDSLPTDEELKAIGRGRMTKLSRGDSEMDGPYERRNDSIRHLKGVLQRSPFIRAEWGNDGTRVSMLMDTGAEISLIDESVLTSVERESLGKPDVQPPQGVLARLSIL